MFFRFSLNRPVKDAKIQHKLLGESHDSTLGDPDVLPLQLKTNLLIVLTPEKQRLTDKYDDVITKITVLRYQRPQLV